MESLKSSKEIKSLIYVIIVLSIVFGFNDGSSGFVFSDWFGNFILTLILVAVVVLTFFVGMKVASKLFNYEIEFSIWKLKKYWFSRWAKFPLKLRDFKVNNMHLGTILALFFTLASNGALFFTAIFTFFVKEKLKIGKYMPYLKNSTESGIALISIVFVFLLIILFKILNIQEGLVIGSWFIIWNLLPIGPLIGSKIFFNSRTLYFGILVFTILFLSTVSVIPWLIGLIIAVLFAVIGMIVYFWKFEYG